MKKRCRSTIGGSLSPKLPGKLGVGRGRGEARLKTNRKDGGEKDRRYCHETSSPRGGMRPASWVTGASYKGG